MKSSTRKAALLAALGLVLLMALAIGVLRTPYASRFALDWARAYLRDHYHAELSVREAVLDVTRGTLKLRDVSLGSLIAPDLPPVVRVEEAFANIGIRELLRGRIVVQSGQIAGMTVHVVVGADGRTNLPQSADAMPFRQLPNIVFQSFSVDRANLLVDNRQQGYRLELPEWLLRISWRQDPATHDVRANLIRPGSFSRHGHTVPVDQLDAVAAVSRTDVYSSNINLRAAQTPVQVRGSVRNLANPGLDLTVDAAVDLQMAERLAEVAHQVDGTINITAHVTGTSASPAVSGHFEGNRLTGFGYDGLHLTSDWRFTASDMRLTMGRLEIRSAQALVQATGVASLSGTGESSVNVKTEGWDVAPITRFLATPMQIASRATASIEASWPGLDVQKGTARARIVLIPSAAPGHDIVPLAGSGSIEAQPGQIRASLNELSSIGARLSGVVMVRDQQRLSGDLQGRVTALDQFQEQLGRLLGRSQPFIPVRVAGDLTASARLGGTLKAPSGSAIVESTGLSLGALKNMTLTAQGEFTKDLLVAREVAATVENQTIRASGTLGLAGNDPPVRLDAVLERASLPALLAAADVTLPVRGTVEAGANLRGTMNRLSGDLRLSANGLEFQDQVFGTLDAAATLDDGTIRTTRFVLQREPPDDTAGSLTAGASYTLGSGQFSLEADARRFLLPAGLPVNGAISGHATGSGTIDSPTLDLTLSMPDGMVKDRTLGPVSLTAALRGETADVHAEAPQLSLFADGQVQVRSPYPASLKLDVRNADVSALQIPVAEAEFLSGSVDGIVTANGKLQDCRDGELDAVVRAVSLTARSHEIHNVDPVEAQYRSGTVTIRSARFAAGSSSVAVAGTIPVEPAAPEGAVTLNGTLDLSDLYPFFNTPPGFSAAGVLKIDMALQGTSRRMKANGGFSMAGGSLQLPGIHLPFTGIGIEASLQNGALLVRSAQTRWGTGRILFSGEVPLGLAPNLPFQFERKQGTARFDLALADLKLESTGELPEGVGGAVDVRVHGELPRPDLDSLNAVATVDRFQINAGELLFEQESRSSITVENGRIRIGQLGLQGPGTRVEVSGTAGISGSSPVDLKVTGNFDAGIISVFTQDIRAAGNTQLDVAVTGTAAAPALSGSVQLQGGQVSVKSFNAGADDLNVTLGLSGHRIAVQDLAGTLNGGVLSGQGTVDFTGTNLSSMDLGLHLDGVYVGYPEGLRAVANADLTVTSKDYPIVVAGTVRIQEGSYTQDPGGGAGLLSSIRATEAVGVTAARNPLLSRIRYNVAVRNVGPVSTSSRMLKVTAHANLKLVGTYYRPSLLGRATFEDGGEIRLNERTYVLDHGSISFVNENRIEPVLDIQGRTQVAGFDINLIVNGTPDNPKTTLTSDPPLAEPDILSLLLTGRTQEEFRGEELQFAKEQALSLVAGEAGARISQGAQRILGLSTVRIEPNLISPESDPGARLTVGENLTSELRLIYSMNLVNSNDQIWIGEYNVSRRFLTRALKQEDNSYRFEFQHDLRFGGSPGSGRVMRFDRTRREIDSITFKGGTALNDEQLRSQLNFKSGDRYDYAKVQKGRDRLRDYYARQERLESKVSVSRTGEGEKVDLILAIAPGPRVRFFYEGEPVPGRVREEVSTVWRQGIFELQRVQDSVQTIRRSLVAEGYLHADVRYRIEQEGDMKNVHFMIRPGTRFHDVKLAFSGNSGIDTGELLKQIRALKMENAVYNDPARLVDTLTSYYRTQGYTHAKVESPKLHLDPAQGSGYVQVVIDEGPQFRIGEVTFEGNTVSEELLRRATRLTPGTVFTSTVVDDAQDRVDRLYHNRGYNDASFSYEAGLDDSSAKANITFHIDERRRDVIRHIAIEGNERTPTAFIQKLLTIAEGQTLGADKVARSRRALYDTGVFSVVDFDAQPVDLPSVPPGTKPVDVTVRLREIKPYSLRYGAFYDTDRGAGFTSDISNRNFLGRAAVLGLHARYDRTMKEVRTYYGQPFFFGIPLRTNITAFAEHESRPAYTLDRAGASLVQEKQLKDRYLLNYGYRYERDRAPRGLPDPLLRYTSTVPLSRLTFSVTRDTRDDILDATRGSFNSQTFEYAPSFLGGDAHFVKYSGQYFRYIPLGRRERIPSGRTISRWVYAGAVRIGLSKGLGGQPVITPERFFAGGGTTVRGFRQDLLGPLDVNGNPTGGEAMFLLNNEVRMPLFKIFDGVGFVDIGNVYRTINDFNPFEVRKTAGVGLRVRTGYVVLRFDYGLKLDRRDGESRGALFFSIGQAY